MSQAAKARYLCLTPRVSRIPRMASDCSRIGPFTAEVYMPTCGNEWREDSEFPSDDRTDEAGTTLR